ncbi:hypothetical protein YC2023_077297 [Brassica napus]
MAVGNPVMQRMLSERRAALGMPPRDPQESDPTRQQPSNPTNYFENILRCALPKCKVREFVNNGQFLFLRRDLVDESETTSVDGLHHLCRWAMVLRRIKSSWIVIDQLKSL